jgi:hypothetical protein
MMLFLMSRQYIKDHLGPKILLSKEEKAPTFLTIQNYLEMEELLWQKDYHNYIHEGSRVDLSTLLKMHCYTSARLQEICQAKYKVRYTPEVEKENNSSANQPTGPRLHSCMERWRARN